MAPMSQTRDRQIGDLGQVHPVNDMKLPPHRLSTHSDGVFVVALLSTQIQQMKDREPLIGKDAAPADHPECGPGGCPSGGCGKKIRAPMCLVRGGGGGRGEGGGAVVRARPRGVRCGPKAGGFWGWVGAAAFAPSPAFHNVVNVLPHPSLGANDAQP